MRPTTAGTAHLRRGALLLSSIFADAALSRSACVTPKAKQSLKAYFVLKPSEEKETAHSNRRAAAFVMVAAHHFRRRERENVEKGVVIIMPLYMRRVWQYLARRCSSQPVAGSGSRRNAALSTMSRLRLAVGAPMTGMVGGTRR